MLNLNRISKLTYEIYGKFKTGKYLEINFTVSKTGKLLKTKGLDMHAPEENEFLEFLKENKLNYN